MTRRRALTPDSVRDMRKWWAERIALPSRKEKARQHGVTVNVLDKVVKWQIYKDVRQ